MPLIKELPLEERPRERLLRSGANKLSNTDLLAILISSGTKRESAMTLAERILSKENNGIHFLGSAIPEDLVSIPGVGTAKSCQILAAVELGKRLVSDPGSDKAQIRTPEDIAGFIMGDMRYLKKESFRILLLNIKNEVISVENISTGNINSSIVDPRAVFSPAIRKHAGSIALVHNHPSGNPEPSNEDIKITQKLAKAGELLDIKVVDHIIIGDGSYRSFRRMKLL